GEPYPTGASPTFEGRPPVPARSGICGPEGEESEEEDFDDQQGDERAPLHIVGLVASLVTRAASRGVAVGRCGVASRSKNMRERDARVVAAAWRLIAREGLGALTVKALADEAGVPPSSMLYTMPNHAVVRERALEAIAPAIRQRIGALPAEPAEGPERARTLLEALLPLDAERRLEVAVLQVLSASALTEPGLQPIWREVDGTIRDVCAQALRA